MSAAVLLMLSLQAFPAFGGTGSSGSGNGSVTPATIAMYGDSRTQGAGSSTPPPNALDALLPTGYTVQNKGVSGETSHQIYTRIASGSATACLGEVCGHYVVQGGVNTLKSASYAESTAEQVANVALNGSSAVSSGTCDTGETDDCGTLDSVDYLHATHPRARIFVIGEMPYAGCDVATCPSLVAPGPRAEAYNAALLTACVARPWLRCVFVYDALEDPEDADHLLPAYAALDGIHLVDAGSAVVAQAVFNAATW